VGVLVESALLEMAGLGKAALVQVLESY
jgi:hypothetical protein